MTDKGLHILRFSHLNSLFLLYSALAFLIYLGSLGNEFLFDDSVYVLENHLIKNLDPSGIWEIFTSFYKWDYLPITFLSFSFDYFLFGLNPWGYHLTNTVLHLFNVFLVHLIVMELSRSRWVAVGTALLFLIHPAHVESVAWISERKNVLSFFFLFLSFFSYLKKDSKAISLVFFILACLSKSSVVIFPLLLVLYEVSFKQKKLIAAIFNNSLYFIIALAVVLVTLMTHSLYGTIQSHPGGSPLHTFFSMVVVFKEYLKTLLFPINLNVWYPNRVSTSLFEGEVLASGLVLGIYVFLTAVSYRKDRRIFFGLVWFGVCLLPVSHIFPIPQMMADRFLYIPSFGLFFVVAMGYQALWERKGETQRGLLLVGIVLLCLTSLSLQRISVFKNDLVLWQDSLAKNDKNTFSMMHLGFSYLKAGKTDRALKALSRAVEIEPENFKAMRVSAIIHENKKQYGRAEELYLQLIEKTPESPVHYTSLGILKGNQGEYDEAIALLDKALFIDPDFALAHYNRGALHFQAGKQRLSLQGYQKAAQLKPDNALYHYQLGMFYFKVLGNLDLGRRHLKRSLRLNPDQKNVETIRSLIGKGVSH